MMTSRVLRVKDPRTAFTQVYAKWFDERGGRGLHPAAIDRRSARCWGPGHAKSGLERYIASGAVIGEDCVIGPRT